MPKLSQGAVASTDLEVGLRSKVDERQALVAQRDEILKLIAGLSDEITQTLVIADQKSARVGPYLVTLVENAGRMTLDKHRLVELGVAPETITAATVRGAGFVSLQVRSAGREVEE